MNNEMRMPVINSAPNGEKGTTRAARNAVMWNGNFLKISAESTMKMGMA